MPDHDHGDEDPAAHVYEPVKDDPRDPRRSAMIWLLYYGAGMTYVALARQFGVSAGRIQQIVHKVDRKIRNARRNNVVDSPWMRRLVSAGAVSISPRSFRRRRAPGR